MMVIGLVPGSSVQLEAVVAELQRTHGAHVIIRKLRGQDAAERVCDLKIAIRGGYRFAVVAYPIQSELEAQAIEQANGQLWHIEGSPSATIPIKRKDLMVSVEDKGCYLPVDDAWDVTKHRFLYPNGRVEGRPHYAQGS